MTIYVYNTQKYCPGGWCTIHWNTVHEDDVQYVKILYVMTRNYKIMAMHVQDIKVENIMTTMYQACKHST